MTWRVVAGVLLIGAAGLGVTRVASQSPTARLGAGTLILLLVGVIVGVFRGSAWAVGTAFVFGMCTLWAVTALGLKHDLSAEGAAFGLAWAFALMIATVRSRDARQGLHKKG